MTVCKLLYGLYGRDTRAAQWLNVVVCAIWSVVLIVTLATESEVFGLPALVKQEAAVVLFLVMWAIIAAAHSFTCKFCRLKQVLKTFALVLGALAQSIIANGYVSAYPPLDMMLVVSTALSLWFFGAVFYVMRCEGVNGTITRKT